MRAEIKSRPIAILRSPAILPAILVVAAVCFHAISTSAVTISEYYIDGQIATDSDFTTGVQNVDLSGSAPTVNIPIGDYFRFGVSLVLTNNPNPAAGDAWDLANQARGNPAQPQNLGISSVEFNVPSSDAAGYSLAPVPGPVAPVTGQVIYDSTAVINPDLSFNEESPGYAESGGEVGLVVSNVGNVNASTQPGVSQIAYFAGTSATTSQATPLFTNLAFQSHAAAQVELSPQVVDNLGSGYALTYWTSYSGQNYLTTADILNPLPVLTINVTPTQPLLYLSSSAPPTTYGDQVPLYRPPPFYHENVSGSSPIHGTTFYIAVPDLDTESPSIWVGLELLDGNASATLTDFAQSIAQFAADINDNNEGVEASTVAPGQYYFPQGYNVFLEIPQSDFSQSSGIAYLGLDMTQIDNIPDVADLSISQVIVLPEPASMSIFLAGAIVLRRRKRI